MYHKQWLMKSMIVLMTLATSLNMVSPAIQAAALPETQAVEEISVPVDMEVPPAVQRFPIQDGLPLRMESMDPRKRKYP